MIFMPNSSCCKNIVWKRGQPRNRGQKIVINDKTVTKADLTIEPCVEHLFAVEFVGKNKILKKVFIQL